jgi:hypothetical protein
MSRIAIALCIAVTACVPAVPRVAHVGVAADAAGAVVAAAPAAAPEAPEAVAEDVPEAPPPATTGPLVIGGEVAGTLASEEVRKLPFRAPKGHYQVDLFVKAPQRHHCNDRPGIEATLVDRDEARVGNVFGAGTWNHDHWDKQQATFELASGAYQVTLLAHKCRVYYRVRLTVAP